MIRQRIANFIRKRRCTLLGVGPMSRNCVDAAVELANKYEIPLLMIASRRQIDSECFGGGYVNNWTTAQFADYVINLDGKRQILLARDHGGPWQNPMEKNEKLSLRRAMESAKASYRADIEAGFQILHIDPSIDIHGQPSVDEVLDRVFELYEYCWSEAKKNGREIIFEIGTEEQSGSTHRHDELDYTLNAIHKFCQKQRLPFPTFVVVQTGTRVMETRNVGSFDSPIRIADELPAEIQVPQMVELCSRYDVFMKEHNTDYLSNESLQWHPRLGIHAANVAPEFGVIESRSLVGILRDHNMNELADRFLALAHASTRWDKWMLPDTQATDYDRAIIAGHYVFSSEEGTEIREKAACDLRQKGIDLDEHIKAQIRAGICRYLKYFRLAERL